MNGAVRLTGRGLHTGGDVELRISRTEGPFVFRTEAGEARLDETQIVRADHGVRLRAARIGLDVDTAEHFLAALAGLSLHAGVAVDLQGEEMPLADGAALAFATALAELEVPATAPALRVLEAGVVHDAESRYEFLPGDGVALEVEIEFPAQHIGRQTAAWDGSKDAFLRDVAWARTFGFRRDADALRRAGRAAHVDPTAVMVLDDEGRVEPPGAPARPGEFARHKLLDLIGDLFLFGGPPRGSVRAIRPGHRATHRALEEALRRGIVGK